MLERLARMSSPLARGSRRRPVARDGFSAVWRIALVSALIVSSGTRAAANRAAAPALTAAFVYNFAKFTTWPADAIGARAPVVFCVMGDTSVADALEQLVKGRDLGGRAIAVRQVAADAGVRACHVLYASGLDEARAIEVLQLIGHAAVLTVSDFEEFAQVGGTASVYIENERMRFSFNVASVERARLTVSSKLLTLARIVRTCNARSQ